MIAVLAHGFGLTPDSLAELAGLLKRQGLHPWPVDLGFFGPPDPRLPKEPFLAVGHSYGLGWLVRRAAAEGVALAGVIGLCGFARFTATEDFAPGLPPGQVRRMRRGISRDARAELRQFWDFIGVPDHERPEDGLPEDERLAAALDDLATLDLREQPGLSAVPTLLLGGARDALVSAEHLAAGWPQDARLRLHPKAGHMLPLTHAPWCATEVARFRQALAQGAKA